jgi:hypothetical protein
MRTSDSVALGFARSKSCRADSASSSKRGCQLLLAVHGQTLYQATFMVHQGLPVDIILPIERFVVRLPDATAAPNHRLYSTANTLAHKITPVASSEGHGVAIYVFIFY